MSYRRFALETVAREVVAEAERASTLYGPMHSPHEAFGVLTIEMGEVEHAIHARDADAARAELVQIAAVALRTVAEWDKAIEVWRKT